ncbi:MAG: hypothetical protein WCQ99_04835, partial [Pseudomonadota bacterium]
MDETMQLKRKVFWVAVFWLIAGCLPSLSHARDPENCLFCHKYKRLQAYDYKGILHNYSVDAHLFQESVHGKLSCVECHSDIEKVPHGKIEKVDCAK